MCRCDILNSIFFLSSTRQLSIFKKKFDTELLFQKHVVNTKLEIYYFNTITGSMQQFSFIIVQHLHTHLYYIVIVTYCTHKIHSHFPKCYSSKCVQCYAVAQVQI